VSFRHTSSIDYLGLFLALKLALFFGTTYLALRASLDLSRQKIGLILGPEIALNNTYRGAIPK